MRISNYFREPGDNTQAPSDQPASEVRTVGQETPRFSTQAPAVVGSPDGDPLTPRTRAKVELLAKDIRELAAFSTDQALTTRDQAHRLSELLATGKVAYKELEISQKAALEPLKGQEKAIRACFKPLLQALENFEGRAKRAILVWQKEEDARVQREKRALLKAQEDAAIRESEAEAAGNVEAAAAASHDQAVAELSTPREAPRALRGDVGTSHLRKRWTFEVISEEKVPGEYRSVDEKKIRAAVAAGVREIPGVNIFEADELAVRIG